LTNPLPNFRVVFPADSPTFSAETGSEFTAEGASFVRSLVINAAPMQEQISNATTATKVFFMA
jgi:hypothetical protein